MWSFIRQGCNLLLLLLECIMGTPRPIGSPNFPNLDYYSLSIPILPIYLLLGLILDLQGGFAQLIHLLAELKVLLLQLQPLLADIDAVIAG